MGTHSVKLAAMFLLSHLLLAPGASSQPASVESGRFTTSDGVELHYLTAGSGPTIVFVPGWTMPAEIWEPQLRHFSATHRAVALDPRGHGRSEKPTFGHHPSRRALDVGELLEHLGGEPAVVVAWSLGVQEVLVYTHEFATEGIRALALVDHDIALDPDETTDFVASRVSSVLQERPTYTRALVEAIHAAPQSDEYFERLTQAALAMPTTAAALVSANVALLGPIDLSPAVNSLDCPVLFVFSSLDWAVAAAEKVRETWPEIPVEIIDDTSHALFVDEPEEFNRLLEEFMASIPE